MDSPRCNTIIVYHVTWWGLGVIFEFGYNGYRDALFVKFIMIAFHGVTFTWTCLTIGKYCGMITLYKFKYRL